MNDLRKLIELNPEYPPSEAVWKQILRICLHKKVKPLKGLDKLRYTLMMETRALEQSGGGYGQSTLTDGSGLSFLSEAAESGHLEQSSDPKQNQKVKLPPTPPVPLPEPTVIRFYHGDNPYYLDAKHQIYQADPDQPLVGNLVGRIDLEKGEVVIKDQVVHRLTCKMVSPKEIHGRDYYLGKNLEAYRGLLPKTKYLWQVGKLNEKGKLELLI